MHLTRIIIRIIIYLVEGVLKMKSYSSRELIKIIIEDGWEECRNPRGSHHYYKHSTKKGLVTIPHPKKNIPIKTVKTIFEQASIKIK